MSHTTDAKRGDLVLEVKGLTTEVFTREGVVKAVDDVSFELYAGETLGIVGESGSGKSMTALSLLKLEPRPAAQIAGGEVWLDGEDLTSKTQQEMRRIRGRKISMILQDPQSSLNPVFSIGNQVEEALRVHDRRLRGTKLRDQAIDILRQVRIAAPERRVRDYPHQMSGGMKQRVVGGIGISCQPRVLIADEPTTSLDVTVQAQYLRLLRELQEKTGLGIIFITHDFGIVAKMCDRVAVMYAGKIIEQGAIRATFNHPSHPYTQALMRSVPRLDETTSRLYSIPGQAPKAGEIRAGCAFAPRCEYADQRCRTEVPPVLPGLSRSESHRAACWRLEEPSWNPNLS